ncbi:General alpha-glucoside permease [Fusarium oxysporum f. sp. albedinis]|nr:General alpha-glucoside permease [Fusarium oxysporum f. sp. albedinis]
MDIDRENFGRSLLEVVTAIGVRRNDACDVSLVLILDFSACVNTTKKADFITTFPENGKWEERYFFQPDSAMIG